MLFCTARWVAACPAWVPLVACNRDHVTLTRTSIRFTTTPRRPLCTAIREQPLQQRQPQRPPATRLVHPPTHRGRPHRRLALVRAPHGKHGPTNTVTGNAQDTRVALGISWTTIRSLLVTIIPPRGTRSNADHSQFELNRAHTRVISDLTNIIY